MFASLDFQATVGDEEVTVQDISNAYCSIAEIYLTDEWFVGLHSLISGNGWEKK